MYDKHQRHIKQIYSEKPRITKPYMSTLPKIRKSSTGKYPGNAENAGSFEGMKKTKSLRPAPKL